MKKKPREVKLTVSAQHKRRVHVTGSEGPPRGWPAAINVQTSFDEKRHFRGGDGFIAWLPRAAFRRVRDALDRILGDRR